MNPVCWRFESQPEWSWQLTNPQADPGSGCWGPGQTQRGECKWGWLWGKSKNKCWTGPARVPAAKEVRRLIKSA